MTKGERIKRLRIDKGITQEEMAKLLNTTKQTISKYEKGIVTNIPSDKLEEMAKVLCSTPGYIMGWEDAQKSNDTIADIVVRLRTDPDFLSIAKTLYTLDSEKIRSVQQMLVAFLK